MRSGILFFNTTLYRKNMYRFWPLWACYGVIWLTILPTRVLTVNRDSYESTELYFNVIRSRLWSIPDTLEFGVVFAFCMGVLVAMAMFSYLYTSRSACMMHGLPMRRETLFITSYLSGLSMLLLSNVVVFALTLAAGVCKGVFVLYPLLVWLGAQCAMCLFFYSFAVFCAMFTGHILALPAFYGILNFLAGGLAMLFQALCHIFLYGYSGFGNNISEGVLWLLPVNKLLDCLYWTTKGEASSLSGTLGDWGALLIYAAAGVVLSLIALWVYRRRQVETAGDVVAVQIMRPVFRWGFGICLGLSAGLGTYSIWGVVDHLVMALLLITWGGVGYFAAEMLLKKSFRVLDAWRGCAAMLAVLLLLCAVLEFDLTGFETRVPDAERVTSVTLYGINGIQDHSYQPSGQISDPETIAKVVELHRLLTSAEGATILDQDSTYFTVTYTLRNGDTMRRNYFNIPLNREDIDTPGTLTWAANQLLQDRGRVKSFIERFEEQGTYILDTVTLISLWDSGGERYNTATYSAVERDLSLLWEAVAADYEAGNLGDKFLFEEDLYASDTACTRLLFEWYRQIYDTEGGGEYRGYDNLEISLTARAEHTMAALEELGLIPQGNTILYYNSALNPAGLAVPSNEPEWWEEYENSAIEGMAAAVAQTEG